VIRIAVVSPFFPNSAEPYGGSPIYQTVLALQRVADVEVFCPRITYPQWRVLQPRRWHYRREDSEYAPPGVRVQYIRYPALPVVSRFLNNWICARWLKPYLQKAAPDVILAYCLYPEGYVTQLTGEQLGIPVVLGARGSDLLQIPSAGVRDKIADALRRASFVLLVSEDMRQHALKLGARPEFARTVNNGCDSSVFRLGDRGEARSALEIRPDAEVILFVGRLTPIKGVRELLEALARIVPDHPRLELACIGDDWMDGELQQRAARPDLAGHVRFLGILKPPEVASWLAASNLLCLPSYSEGCPNVVIESLSCGRPVVATQVGGTPELVDPTCSILVPPRNVEALAGALVKALQQPWDAAAIAARFGRSWNEVAAETLEVCSSVVKPRDGRRLEVLIGKT